jgi:hypothetical protein
MYSAKYCMGNDLLQYIFRTTNSTKITGEIVVFWAIIISGCPLFAVTINPENVTVHVVFVSKATGWDFEGLCSGGKGQMLHLPISLWIMIDGVDNILSLCHMCYGCVSLLYFQRLIVFTMNILSFFFFFFFFSCFFLLYIYTMNILSLSKCWHWEGGSSTFLYVQLCTFQGLSCWRSLCHLAGGLQRWKNSVGFVFASVLSLVFSCLVLKFCAWNLSLVFGCLQEVKGIWISCITNKQPLLYIVFLF